MHPPACKPRAAFPEPEAFVSADRAAEFLGVRKKFLLELARRGCPGAYPIGTGRGERHTWVFLLSELSEGVKANRRTWRKL